jgi:hypothetical protein
MIPAIIVAGFPSHSMPYRYNVADLQATSRVDRNIPAVF